MSLDDFGILVLAVTVALVARPHLALSRLRRPGRPETPPPPSDAPAANQDGGEWIEAEVSIAAWHGWVDDVGPAPAEASCYVEVAPRTELDAIAARFDAAWDAAASRRMP